MSTTTQPRQPKGIPVGGQFATSAKAEAGVSLTEAQPVTVPAEPTRAFPDTDEVFTKKYDSVDEKVEAYKAELDKAVGDLATDQNWLSYLDMISKFHRYSPTNQLLIAIQTRGRATRVAGFRAWQQNFNRTVNKGEKAISIFAPRMVNKTVTDGQGNPVKDENGKPVRRKIVIGYTTASVFDVSQTSGEPLPEIETELSEAPPEGFVDDMVAAAKKEGYTVEFREMDSHAAGTAQGWTDPRRKQIVVDASQTPGSQAATLAHELGHVYAGHCEPDNADKYHVGPGGCRGRFEVEAESVAYTLTRANGMSMDGAKLSAQYVAGWSRHDREALKESAETVSKATKKILGSAPFRNATGE